MAEDTNANGFPYKLFRKDDGTVVEVDEEGNEKPYSRGYILVKDGKVVEYKTLEIEL